jgi:hypothetical protein
MGLQEPTPAPARDVCAWDAHRGENIVAGKEYLTRQAATVMKFANTTTDREVAARLIEKAVDLQCRLGDAAARPDRSARAPDVEP